MERTRPRDDSGDSWLPFCLLAVFLLILNILVYAFA